jgi:O-antigen/teichoic acid export membrane protein
MQVMTFLVMISLARELEPATFGIYAFAVFVGASLSELSLGTGVDLAAIRLSAPYWQSSPERAWLVFQLVGVVKIALGVSILLLGVVGADFVGNVLLNRPEFVAALRTAAVAVLALTLTEFALSILQARERFGLFALFGVGVALVRTAPLFALIAVYHLSISAALVTYLFSLYLGCVLALAPSRRHLMSARGSYRGIAEELLGYAGWVSLTVFLATLANSMDTLALTYFNGPREVGIYAAARTFATGIAVFTMASMAVLLPKFGRMTERRARRRALARAAVPLTGLALALAVGICVMALPLVRAFYGVSYLEAGRVLQVLVCAYSLDLATTTLAVFLLVENRPDVLTKATAVGLLAALIGYVWLVPLLGALGAALVFFGYRLVSTVICLVWLVFTLSLEKLNSGLVRDAMDIPQS